MATQWVGARCPFTPSNGAYLQELESLNDRQNALQISSPLKRKITEPEVDGVGNGKPRISLSPKRYKHLGTPSREDLKGLNSSFIHFPRTPTAQITFPGPKIPSQHSMSSQKLLAPNSPRVEHTINSPECKNYAKANKNMDKPYSPRIDMLMTSTSNQMRIGGNPTPRSTKKKKLQYFDIYQDDDTMLETNIIDQDTCDSCCSTDEKGNVEDVDAKGKENIPPNNDIALNAVRVQHHLRSENNAMKKRRAFSKIASKAGRAPLVNLDLERFIVPSSFNYTGNARPVSEVGSYDCIDKATLALNKALIDG
ncbi:hypothetical protein BGT96224_427 [Blumeria graminis f. sp. tritici 96224]|nr:hypothetical protein BGT96224_427 [Blumeria graminis f. sp. tritici 96224]